MNFHEVFHGTLQSPNQITWSSMESHGTFKSPFEMTPGFRVLPWNIAWNSIELGGGDF